MASFAEAVMVALRRREIDSDCPTARIGRSRYGISEAAHPDVDIEHLTVDQARDIYLRRYWQPGKYDQLVSQAVANKMFDLHVFMGPTGAVVMLQRALRAVGRTVEDDGVMGPATIAAANVADATALVVALRSEAAGHCRHLVSQDKMPAACLAERLNRAYA